MQLVTRRIISTANGFSRVLLANEVWKEVTRTSPTLEFTLGKDKENNEVRVFDFNGVKLYMVRKFEEGQKYSDNTFIMQETDAKASLHADRNNLPEVEFDIQAILAAENIEG